MATFSDAEIAENTMAIAGAGGSSNADSNAPAPTQEAEVMGGPMAIAGPTGTDADHSNSTPPATAPSKFTSLSNEWFCIQNYFRRNDLVFIQILGRREHGYTLNEHDELNYWRKGPGDEIVFTPLQYELIIRPEELGQDLCKLVPIGYDNHVGDDFTAEFLRYTHLMPEDHYQPSEVSVPASAPAS